MAEAIEGVEGDALPLLGWAVLTPGRKLVDRHSKLPNEYFLCGKERMAIVGSEFIKDKLNQESFARRIFPTKETEDD